MADGDRQRRWPRRVAIGVAVLLALAALALVVVNAIAADPGPEADAALISDDVVTVDRDGGAYRLDPTAEPACVALVFHPGGLVEGEAYAAHLRPLAAAGYRVFVVDPPLNLAVLDADAAAEVIDDHPEVDAWVVGGHSLGGAMAARFAARNGVDGLLLWAAFPPGEDDLSAQDFAVASVYGTEDGLASVEEVTGTAAQLPGTTEFVAVDGGNHAGFGDYGSQRGHNPATIGPAEQRSQIVDASLELLDRTAAATC